MSPAFIRTFLVTWAVVRMCVTVFTIIILRMHIIISTLKLDRHRLWFSHSYAAPEGHSPGCPIFQNFTIVQQPANMLTIDDMYNNFAVDFIKSQAGEMLSPVLI